MEGNGAGKDAENRIANRDSQRIPLA